MKILIFARTIFPSQFPRSFRASELALELARQGHEVIIYAVLGNFDYSSVEANANIKIKNFKKMHFATLNSDEKGRDNLLDKILRGLLKRFFEYPNIEFLFKIPNIIKNEIKFDYLISIASPHPIHWACALSKLLYPKKFPEVWTADCGDPYMGNRISKHKPMFYFKYVEKWFCKRCDFLTVPFAGAIQGYYPEFHNKIFVIPQGFRFGDCTDSIEPNNAIPTFAYSGIFYKNLRDPTKFLEYLTNLERPFKFFIFTRDDSIIKKFNDRLKSKVEVRSYIPREELLKFLSKMDFLINFENCTKVQSPSKLIDYAITKRPIIQIDSNFSSKEIFIEFLNKNYNRKLNIENIQQYSITNVAQKFIELYYLKKNKNEIKII